MVTIHTFDIAATIAFWFLALIWSLKGRTGLEVAFNWCLKFGFLGLALTGSWFLLLQALAQTKLAIR